MNTINVKSNGLDLKLQVRDDADASVIAEIFKEHEYRIVESAIRAATDPILDIGAHAGYFSLYVRSLNPEVKIIAVEPEPNNIEFLKTQLDNNQFKNIDIINAALSAKTGNRKFILSKDSHNHRLMKTGEGDTGKQVISVYTYSLSDLIKKCILNKVSVLKMDIEGGEHEVFDSLNDDELKKIDTIIMEYHLRGGYSFKDIQVRLGENGFGVQVFPSRFDKKMGFIFAKSKR